MNDAVDRVMASYENLPALERLGCEEIRVKVGQYLAKLSSAGHSDAEELTFYGLTEPQRWISWDGRSSDFWAKRMASDLA
jgi:hypothetical protein